MGKIKVELYPKRMRRELHDLNKHPKQRVMQLREIPKPKFVTQTDGQHVKYEGP